VNEVISIQPNIDLGIHAVFYDGGDEDAELIVERVLYWRFAKVCDHHGSVECQDAPAELHSLETKGLHYDASTGLSECEDVDNFLGYAHTSTPSKNEWKTEIELWRFKVEQRRAKWRAEHPKP
jgi:hypothetical protein